jgi:hypothetical protein
MKILLFMIIAPLQSAFFCGWGNPAGAPMNQD